MTRTAIKEERRKSREQAQREKQEKEAIEAIEKEIALAEKRVAELHEMLCCEEVYSNPDKSREVHEEVRGLEGHLEQLYEQWEQKI
jgi:ATP-binding cassette subfamily F protein 3